MGQIGGIKTLEDYRVLYNGQWKKSVPGGVDAGVLENETSDLYFSMERLSASPFSVRRLHPFEDNLPFAVEPEIVANLTGVALETLHSQGRLFLVDHSVQLVLSETSRYGGACSAYFYIAPDTAEFLPLAIKTNTDADLIYTPLDPEQDWLLAKIMMNSNEAIFNEVYHVTATHAVQEIVHLAALRTMHPTHPVLALLTRLMDGAYAPRAIGEKTLTNKGGIFDTYSSITGKGAQQLIGAYYANGAGSFQANYFVEGLMTRGLLNCTYGPPLKHFPFFEDASAIYLSLRRFMTSFVESYYKSTEILKLDPEIKSWILQAQTEAHVIDFPKTIHTDREELVDALTHFAFLGVVHSTISGRNPVSISSTLPLHPASLYAPLPREKGITNVMPWLPNATTSVAEIGVSALFSRPMFEAKHLTLLHAFHDDEFLERMNEETRQAEQVFREEMSALSEQMRSRRFDPSGLSQGMPFVWTALDPAKMPFSSVV